MPPDFVALKFVKRPSLLSILPSYNGKTTNLETMETARRDSESVSSLCITAYHMRRNKEVIVAYESRSVSHLGLLSAL